MKARKKPYFDSAIFIMEFNKTVKDYIGVLGKVVWKVLEGPSKFYEA